MSKVPELNDNQQRFATIYASHPLYRGNGLMSYALAYGWIEDGETQIAAKSAQDTCKTNASRMLKDDRICNAIRKVLDTIDLNDVAVDSKLAFLIHQTEDKGTSLGAVKEYYRITNRGGQAEQSGKALIQNLYMQIINGNQPPAGTGNQGMQGMP